MAILVITTGGTIGAMPYKDLKHQAKIKTMPGKGQDFVRTALQKFPELKTHCVSMEQRDSNHIDDAYLAEILKKILSEEGSGVLITVGTDRILSIADYFYKQTATNNKLKDKTLILTGAMVALSCGPESDGFQNLRFSLRQLQQGQINRGIYIVLCDYQDDSKEGWQPKLYRYTPGQYEKSYDLEDNRRSRIRRING